MTDRSSIKHTLWFWPSGLYPRRVAYYLKAKQLPASVLQNLTIIPYHLDKQAFTFKQAPGCEPRPAGCSVPALRAGNTHMIYQSSSILAYFEEVYGPSLSGRDPLHRARVADIAQQVNVASVWTSIYLQHTSETHRTWYHIPEGQQFKAVGIDALNQWRIAMMKLETWVREDIVEKKSNSIAGGDEPTLADFTLMAIKPYLLENYGLDVFEGFDVLNIWHERAVKSEWYADGEGLACIEGGDFSTLFKH